MIVDISNEIFTNIKNTLTNVTVLPSYPSTTPTFPCLVFEEKTNNSNSNTIDSNGEKYNDISFEINIFTNSETKVFDAKEIRNQVDAIMSGQYGMNRSMSGQVPNFADTNLCRYTLRYNCTVGQDKKVYRR